MQNLLEKMGLHRRELRAWALYDWANSAFITTVIATILPIFYAEVAGVDLPQHLRTAYWGYTAGISLFLVAVISPVFGAMADYLGAKKKFIFIFMLFGVIGSGGLYFVGKGDWQLASLLCLIGNIGFSVGNVFYEALLPHIAKPDEVDRVSSAGYAIGYIGGGILLVLNLVWIEAPHLFGFSDKGQAVRFCFVSVAIWWALFSIPLFRHVKEPVTRIRPELLGANPISMAFSNLRQTFKEIRSYKQVFLFLCAFWLYMDGIGTIIKMATIYGKELGFSNTDLIGAFILVQFLGLPCTLLFGTLAGKIGAKKGLMISLTAYVGICIFGFFMAEAWQFWCLAGFVGVVQGGAQALSRSIFASMIPREKSAEFFGFFTVSSKFAGVFGPLLFGVLAQNLGGSSYSILFLISFFVGGMLLLSKVDIEDGRRAALTG